MDIKEWEEELNRVLREMDSELESIRRRVKSWTKEARGVPRKLGESVKKSCNVQTLEKTTKNYSEETRELMLNTIRVFKDYLNLKRELDSLRYMKLDEEDEYTDPSDWINLLHKRLEVDSFHEEVTKKVVFLGGYVACLEDLMETWTHPKG